MWRFIILSAFKSRAVIHKNGTNCKPRFVSTCSCRWKEWALKLVARGFEFLFFFFLFYVKTTTVYLLDQHCLPVQTLHNHLTYHELGPHDPLAYLIHRRSEIFSSKFWVWNVLPLCSLPMPLHCLFVQIEQHLPFWHSLLVSAANISTYINSN